MLFSEGKMGRKEEEQLGTQKTTNKQTNKNNKNNRKDQKQELVEDDPTTACTLSALGATSRKVLVSCVDSPAWHSGEVCVSPLPTSRRDYCVISQIEESCCQVCVKVHFSGKMSSQLKNITEATNLNTLPSSGTKPRESSPLTSASKLL